MRIKSIMSKLTGVALAGALPLVAHAGTVSSPTGPVVILPAPTIGVGITEDFDNHGYVTSYDDLKFTTAGHHTGLLGLGIADVQLSPFGAVTARASAGTGAADATANLTWSWAVVGPECGCYIPVDSSVNLKWDGGTLGGGIAAAELTGPYQNWDSMTMGGSDAGSWSGTLHTLTIPNAAGTMLLTAYANAFAGSAYAYADPDLFIDPSFAAVDPNYLQDYQILLSPEMGNAAAAIPEPATALLLGTVVLPFLRRRVARGSRLNAI